MRFFSSKPTVVDDMSPASATPPECPSDIKDEKPSVAHEEHASDEDNSHFKVSKTGDGDAAMALFHSPTEVREPIDPEEERKLLWKIDLMILPCTHFSSPDLPSPITLTLTTLQI